MSLCARYKGFEMCKGNGKSMHVVCKATMIIFLPSRPQLASETCHCQWLGGEVAEGGRPLVSGEEGDPCHVFARAHPRFFSLSSFFLKKGHDSG